MLRIYTALVNSFHPRVLVTCSKKTTMAEVVQLALAKCGKGELDHRRYVGVAWVCVYIMLWSIN